MNGARTGAAAALLLLASAAAAQDIALAAVEGLAYSLRQFAVAPGAKVTLVFSNTDPTDMPHNLVFTRPGRREAVVAAALTLGDQGEALGFVPKTDDVLWAIPTVPADQVRTLTFTAPKEAGIYPYVCTYPGHGFVMFGDMYVGTAMPAEPAAAPVVADGDHAHHHAAPADPDALGGPNPHPFPLRRPLMYRMFMPDSGPASIAVALPGGQNYCWDAGTCRLRYAWSGDFVDNQPYWKGNGNGKAVIKGAIWYRAGPGAPLRAGTADPATVDFKGYRLVDGVPEFTYALDGVEVKELITAAPGGAGLVISYRLATPRALTCTVDVAGGARPGSPVGAFADGRLAIPAAKAGAFTITIAPPVPAAIPAQQAQPAGAAP